MGSRARPSRSCSICRGKRRKCDLKQPCCTQCTRAGVACPGYADAFTLRLRDETGVTAEKVQKRKGRGKFISLELDNPPSDDPGASRCASLSQRLAVTREASSTSFDDVPSPSGMDTPLELVATTFFLEDYCKANFFQYLPRFYSDLSLSVSSVRSWGFNFDEAIAAPALVLLSRDLQRPALLSQAYTNYSRALKATQKAIRDPQLAKHDGTLASILLLGLFEALVFRGRCTPGAWDAHLNGSAALLELRGLEQCNTPLGLSLYLHASSNVRRYYTFRGFKVLPSLTKLNSHFLSAGSGIQALEKLSLHMGTFMDKFALLLHSTRSGEAEPSELLEQSVKLGAEVDEMLLQCAEMYPYEVVPTVKLDFEVTAYGDVIHIHSSVAAAKRWNSLRMVRMFTCETAQDALEALSSEKDFARISSLLETVQNTADKMASHILHSVPHAVGSAPTAAKIATILPLASIAVSDVAPLSARDFARDRLHFMASELHVPQAQEAYQMVLESPHLENWMSILHSL